MQSAFNRPDAHRRRIIPGSAIPMADRLPVELVQLLGNKMMRSVIFLHAAPTRAAADGWR
jgi:hypothetical protein